MTFLEIVNKKFNKNYQRVNEFWRENSDYITNVPESIQENADYLDYDKVAIEKIDKMNMPIAKWINYLFKVNSNCNVFHDTYAFQDKFELLDDNMHSHFIADDQMKVKIGHLHEELAEIEKAYAEGNLSEFADGIIDLIYVAAGLGALCKLPMSILWRDVQYANTHGKERVKSLENATKRGSTFDVRKTDKWLPPRGKEIIEYTDNKLRKYLL